jgi:ureidoacrylate peracid hydrolase
MPLFPTRPEPIEIELDRCALVIVDMQNAFATKGGMFELSGMDISGAQRVIGALKAVVEIARSAGVQIAHVRMAYDPSLANSGGPDSPNWHKELALLLMRKRPELNGKVLTEGGWDAEIVDELKPQREDWVVTKTRYSGFHGTPLDSMLRTRGIRTLVFAGIATNVCVESTLRDAFFHDYWPVLLRDASMQAGPPLLQEATVQNVELCLGWTLSCSEFVETAKDYMCRGALVHH